VGQPQTQFGQKQDTVLISPSWQGSFGPINAMVQGSFQFGTVEGSANTRNPDLDVRSWAAIGYLEANLGMVTPFVALIYGSGDEDPFDRDLKGFAIPHREITSISGHPFFDKFDTTVSWGERGSAAPGRVGYAGGAQFRHTVGNPFSDRIGNSTHVNRAGVVLANTSLSNPGVLMPMAGVTIEPLKGHEVSMLWAWVRLDETDTLRVEAIRAGVRPGLARFEQDLTHEFQLQYTWTLNPHFDIRLTGNVMLPQDGVKTIAATQDCEPSVAGLQRCEGEDVLLKGEARFRARF